MTAMSENGWVAYVMGDATGNKTLYTWHDGERQAIVGTDGGPFVDLFGLSVNNRGQVFFAGQLPPPDPSDPNGQSGKWGIYFGADAENEKLIAEGDTLFGDTVLSLGLSPYALNNHGQLVFTAQFVNHSEVILAEPVNPAAVPLPAALPAGALGLVAVAGTLRARRKRI
jgi:hypothetical protein